MVKMNVIVALILGAIVMLPVAVLAQRPYEEYSGDKRPTRFKVAFYNVETFFDTIRNPLTDDADFTPTGAKRWTGVRYHVKLDNIARVIDEMDADILGVAEVENENVVRDLLLTMKSNYNYIHYNTSDRRGMDVALLYRGDKFFPDGSRQIYAKGLGREFLVVWGELAGERVYIVVCHMPSQFNKAETRKRAFDLLRNVVERFLADDPAARVIVMGDFNDVPESGNMRYVLKTAAGMSRDGAPLLFNPFYEMSKAGYGSYVYRDRHRMYDNILLSQGLTGGNVLIYNGVCGVFVRSYMMEHFGPMRGYPFRTFAGRTYKAGFSDHLPVYIYLEKRD